MIIRLFTPEGSRVTDTMKWNPGIATGTTDVYEKNIEVYMKEFRKENKYPIARVEIVSEKNLQIMYTKEVTPSG